jgi:hypothetical protein
MSLNLHSRFSTSLGGWHISAIGTISIIVSCATLGVAMGVLFPMRSIRSFHAVTPNEEHDGLQGAPSSIIEASASAVLPADGAVKTAAEHESPTNLAPVTTKSSRDQRTVGKAVPILTDNPCRWSQSADGTLTCTGRQVMTTGAGDAFNVRQCGMVFHDKVRFSGIDMHVVSKQTKGNPFLVRSPKDWKMNFETPNSTEISVLFTADTPEPGKVICQFSYRLEKVP